MKSGPSLLTRTRAQARKARVGRQREQEGAASEELPLAHWTRLLDVERGLATAAELMKESRTALKAGFYHRDSRDGAGIWAPELFDIFGLENSGRAPSPDLLYKQMDPRDRSRVFAALAVDPTRQRSVRIDYRIIHPRLGLRFLRNVGGILAMRSPTDFSWVGTLTDVTNVHSAEMLLEQGGESLSALIAGQSPPRTQHAVGGGLTTAQLYRVEQWIFENVESPITLDSLALVTGQARSRFVKLFKNTTGLSPYQFVLRAKLERAKELLVKCRHETVAAVATRLGFFDQSHFHRHFRKRFGLTPADYLKTAMMHL